MQHDCGKSLTRTRQECKKSEILDFENARSENIFEYPCIYYMTTERLQGERQFYFKDYILKMPPFHSKMRLKVHHSNWTL